MHKGGRMCFALFVVWTESVLNEMSHRPHHCGLCLVIEDSKTLLKKSG